MKPLDIYLRDVRFARARPFIRPGEVVLDVGCEEGALFESLRGLIKRGIGIDSALPQKRQTPFYTLHPGTFPQDIPAGETCDVLTMLAVLEHIPPADQERLAACCHAVLNPGGRVVITVPSPRVDQILHGLRALRLVQAETLHEHYGFDVQRTPSLFGPPLFRLAHADKFQLGLNNLFVFERL